MFRTVLSTIALATAISTAWAAPAAAAPQILGLMATNEPVPLTCADGVCTAELTTVCLQEHRPSPMPGTAYAPAAGPTRISLAAGGREIDVTRHIKVSALRNISSVMVSLPESALAGAGGRTAGLSVAPLATVVPVARPGDAEPQTAAEIESATGHARAVADRVFEGEAATMTTLGLLNQMLNRMPDTDAFDTGEFDRLWGEVVEDRADSLPGEVRLKSEAVAESCREEAVRGLLPGMKSCLAYHHDALASETNKKVWRALKPNG